MKRKEKFQKISSILFLIICTGVPLAWTFFNHVNYSIANLHVKSIFAVCALFIVLGVQVWFLVPGRKDELFKHNFLKAALVGFTLSLIGLTILILVYAMGAPVILIQGVIIVFAVVVVGFLLSLFFFEKYGLPVD